MKEKGEKKVTNGQFLTVLPSDFASMWHEPSIQWPEPSPLQLLKPFKNKSLKDWLYIFWLDLAYGIAFFFFGVPAAEQGIQTSERAALYPHICPLL